MQQVKNEYEQTHLVRHGRRDSLEVLSVLSKQSHEEI